MKVGDTVYVVPFFGKSHETKVTKVGRMWGNLEGHRRWRFNITTGNIDGGGYSSPGRVWPSKAAHDSYVDVCREWDELRMQMAVHIQPPQGVGMYNIRMAREWLKVKR